MSYLVHGDSLLRTWRVRTEAEAAALMMRSSHGQLVVDSFRSLRAASSGITAVAEGAAGAGSGSRISYREKRNFKTHEGEYFLLFKCFCFNVYAFVQICEVLSHGQLISKQKVLTGFFVKYVYKE
jgi:hypothetical protein